MNNEIKVTSHVGRDVLQTSAFFNSVALVVWEYLINGIEYRHSEDQRKPSVYVSLNKKKKMIQIKYGCIYWFRESWECVC